MKPTLLRLSLTSSVIATALAGAPAWAQEPPTDCVMQDGVCVPSDALDTAAGDIDDEAGAIVVTGTRIQRPELEAANPIVSVSSEAIQMSGQTNVTELLAQTPALFNSETNYDAAGSQARFGGAGVNLLDLRNLGPKRTLVLVNGRRHIAGVAGEASVDINTIPLSLIDRVDVLTGGVSAVYGADAVSGVVNFVLKRDFEGIDVRAQSGISEFGDGNRVLASATLGTNFADDRGNIVGSYEYRQTDRVGFEDRPIGRTMAERLVRNPDDVSDDPNVPDYAFLNNLRWADSSPDAAVIVDTSQTPLFRGGGQPFELGTYVPGTSYSVGGSSTPIAGYQGDLQAGTENHIFNLLGSYELTPALRLFAEGKYVTSEAFTVAQPSFDFFTFVSADNPFIPQNIQDAIVPGNLAPYGLPDGVLINRDNFDLGTRDERVERDLYRGVIGAEYDVTDDLRFEISYVYGQNDFTFVSDDQRVTDRYFAALDAVDEGELLTGTPNGNIVCRVDVTGGVIDPSFWNYGDVAQTFTPGADSGCVPLNVFGEGVASQAALDFVHVDLENEATLKQHVVNAFFSGDTGSFELPGGPIGFAAGGEYRKEVSRYRPDPIATQTVEGDPTSGVLADLALLANEDGSFDVWEVFGEVSVPILAYVPFAERLEVGGAVRVSDYSTIGTTTTWKVDGFYQPVEDIAFRGSYSQAVRAPNITELYAPTTGAYSFLDDPCDPVYINEGTEFREANCRALLRGLGVDPDTYNFEESQEAGASLLGTVAGNPDLSEEEATTWTAGAVIRPRFLPRLAISVDWYDIRLEGAINTATLQQTAEFCVDAPTLDNAFCENVTRSATTGYVTNYLLAPENVAFFETAGADVTVGYSFAPSRFGTFNVRGTVGYLDKLEFLPANGGIVDNDRGEVGAPKWVGTGDVTWSKGNLMLNYGLNFTGEQLRFEHDRIAAQPDIVDPEYLAYDSAITHDIRAELTTEDERYAFYVGANNFTNEQPGRGSANTPVGFLGRFFYAGIRMTSPNFGF